MVYENVVIFKWEGFSCVIFRMRNIILFFWYCVVLILVRILIEICKLNSFRLDKYFYDMFMNFVFLFVS